MNRFRSSETLIKRRLTLVSDAIAVFERIACCALLAILVGLILLNVITRALDVALFWVDELAVYSMIWCALFGASLLLHERRHVTVTILTAAVSQRHSRILLFAADTLVLVFAAGLFLMCLAWYDLPGLASYQFNLDEFAASSFNFIYQEPTNTIGIQKFWVWLVVPISAVAMTIHAVANLVCGLDGKVDT